VGYAKVKPRILPRYTIL